MRIISGSARGTKLFTLDGENTRPTLDRVKEPLFSIINFDLTDSVVLDLFAGSGALGLEALSRGAKEAVFCDKNLDAIKVIKKNINKTRFDEKSVVIKNDFESALKYLANDGYKFDIIFLDPPYNTNYIFRSLSLIIDNMIIQKETLIIAETDDPERIQNEINNLDIEILDKRKYGRAYLIFIKIKR